MLLWLLQFGLPAGLEKITPRMALAAAASFVLCVLIGPACIRWLRGRFGDPNKSDSPEIRCRHAGKRFTPTLGGLFMLAGCFAALLLFGDLKNPFFLTAMGLAGGLAAVGVVDDWIKLRTAANGLSARTKLLGQTAVAAVAATVLYFQLAALPDGLSLQIPGIGPSFSLGWLFIPWAVTVILAGANAVNLADGLDGLAGGCTLCAAAAIAVLVYVAGHAELAEYLQVQKVPGAGELAVAAAALLGAVLGFLWFNCHPAQVFMGDTGSLPLGGLLGYLALVARQELLLIVIGGVFVAEALSVILQVGFFKWRKRRIFRCAPLHHHFQFLGWPENKIVVRFWIAAALCALLGVATLKLPSPALSRENRELSHVKSIDPPATAVAGRWRQSGLKLP
ncbi:MAG: phospho-N-acetylmuramoyl-pentapeptide-transferase [Pirellulales bacterium]|nr:phospho-N-acetylmuramoyl-pentapeptide-transferase [Pirellulales bacterium]